MLLKKKIAVSYDASLFGEFLASDQDATSTPSPSPSHNATAASNDTAAFDTAGVAFGTEGDDTMIASQAEQIFAGGGDDEIHASVRASILDAGNGYDCVVLTGAGGFHDVGGISGGWVGIEKIVGTESGDELNAGLGGTVQTGLEIDTRGGRDTIIATSGNDTIIGGAGDDTMTGGSGADVFIFKVADVAFDTVTDFAVGEDVISFAGLGLAYEDLTIADVGEGALIVTGHQQILLAGVEAQSLSQASFAF